MNPRWVPKSAVLAIHEWLLAEHGGSSGILSEDGLDAALASPQNHLAYAKPDIFDLASQYAYALSRNHPFQDGNKRIALTVAGVFLEMNGFRLSAEEPDAVSAMLALSTNEVDAKAFAGWLRANSSEHPAGKSRRKRANKIVRVRLATPRKKRPRG